MLNEKWKSRLELIALVAAKVAIFVVLIRYDVVHWLRGVSVEHGQFFIGEIVLFLVLTGLLSPILLLRKHRAMMREHAAHAREEKALRDMVEVDALTQLGNRTRFKAVLPQYVSRAKADKTEVSLLKIDVDRFKQINDLRGLPAGDIVLSRVANRIKDICDPDDTVLRVGGDEFGVLTCASREDALALANRILRRLRDPFEFQNWSAEISVSIGVATLEAGMSTADLVGDADQAMFWAKETGRDRVIEFDRSIGEEVRKAAQIRADLIEAVEGEKIIPYFQPIFSIRDGSLYGFEALARWHHPERGFISPEYFIALSEDLGMINDLTDHLFLMCCEIMTTWPADLRLSFNLSPVQLSDRSQNPEGPLVDRLRASLAKTGIAAERINLEITEKAVIDDLETARLVVAELRELGIQLSLDDFGTGTSSLSVQSQLPFDTIKIDRSFITDIAQRPDHAKIVSAVLSLAASMGMDVTAEGIETPTELDFLKQHDCAKGQGYLLGRPVPHDEIAPFIARGKAERGAEPQARYEAVR